MAKNRKIALWSLLAITVIIIIVVVLNRGGEKEEYITEVVQKNDIFRTISVTGEITPEKRADLAFETGGKIRSIEVKVGDEVEDGQVVAMIGDGVIKAQLWGAQVALDIQRENLGLSRRKWDDLKPEERAAKKLAVDQARASVQITREQLGKTVLHSPIKGIVSERNAEPGEVTGIGATVVSIIQRGELKIEADIPESDIAEVSLGQKADITFDALPSDEIFKAEIFEIEPAATIIQDVVYYKVKLKLENIDQRLKTGMSADIDILTAQENSVLVVPERAVESENGAKIVQVLLENGEVKKVEVKTGLRGDDGNVEIISGLKEGDEVVMLVKKE
nr:efflux RND transporter periplasmic adaptor subunit [Patescibacteria group bacterium]